MFLCAVQPYIVAVIIAVIVAQYAFALFCLLKLAYLDLGKKQYVLWNLFILLIFFIGGAAFLVYYYKHPDLRIQKTERDLPSQDNADERKDDRSDEQAENVDENASGSESAEQADGASDGK